jgi:hypothetical protein
MQLYRMAVASAERYPRTVAVSVVCAAAVVMLYLHLAFASPSRTKAFVSRENIHVIERRLVEEHHEKASAVIVCLIMTSHSNVSLDRTVRVLNHAYIPSTVAVHLVVVSSTPVAIRKDAWHRGNCTVFRNASLVRFRGAVCFIVVQDTVDMGPYFIYWMWRAWVGAGDQQRLLVAGDATGTSGVIPHHEVWVRFVRSERALGNADAMRRYFHYFCRTVVNATVLHPPIVDGYAVARAVRQSMVEPEREPRLVRVWDERFAAQAVVLRI